MADKPSGKPKGPPPSMFDWTKKVTLFTVGKWMLWAILVWAVLAMVLGGISPMGRPMMQGQQQLPIPGLAGPIGQPQVVQQGVYLRFSPEWTQIELSAKPTTIFLPAQPFHLDIRPGGDCQGWLNLGNERIPLSSNMPLLNRRIPVMVEVCGQGSVFFQVQPVR